MGQQIYEPAQDSKNNWVKIVIIMGIILIIGGGIWDWINLNKSKTAGEQWVEFIGPKQNYALKYPENWIVNEVNSIYVTINSPENEQIKQSIELEGHLPSGLIKAGYGYSANIAIAYFSSIMKGFGAENLEELANQQPSMNKINFAGAEAWERPITGNNFTGYVIMIENKNYAYQITFNKAKTELTDTDKRIIASFKFIE
ncbi:MAG: hypothetical protein KAI53_02575 [Candidatus Aenigmarchaeota archaeon]|nr:hypothetical protein [Candidatus Aenigmarchaeota archaeon]